MKKLLVFLGIVLIFSACMTISPYAKQGEIYLMRGRFDEAVKAYETALQSDPTNPEYKAGLYRAKLAASIHYWMKGEKELSIGDKTSALKFYRKALTYQPSNEAIIKRIEKLSGGKVKERRRRAYAGPRAKVSLNFTRTNLKTIFKAFSKYSGVNFIFDEGFRNINYSISMENVDFEDALRLLCASTQNFYYKIDDKNYLIIPDNLKKREQYITKKVRIFYLRYTSVKSMRLALGMILLGRRRTMSVSYDEFMNAIIVKGTDDQIEYVEKLIDRLDRPKGEVIIQAEVLEVNRSKLAQMGLDLSNYSIGAGIIAPSTGTSKEGGSTQGNITLNTLRNLTGDDIAIIMPDAYLRFLETATESRIMAKPLLRGLDGEKVTLKIGNRVPIPQTVFSPIAAGGMNIQPVTSFQYQDVGIVMEMEPRINSKDEVTLKLKINVSSIAGQGYNNLPILGNREVEMTARVKGGETVIIAGLLRNEESQTVKSPPFFARLPIIGWVFSNLERKKDMTDVVISLTPYIVNYTEPTVEEQKAIVSAEGKGLTLKGGEKGEAQAPEEKIKKRRLKPSQGSSINIFPKRIFTRKGTSFTTSISYNGEPVSSGEIVLEFSQGLQVDDITPAVALASASFMKNITGNRVILAFTLTGGKTLKSDQIALIRFKMTNNKEGNISIVSASMRTPSQEELLVNLPEPVTITSTK